METATIYPKNYTLHLKVPNSIVEVIDRLLEYRVADGESSVSRTSIAMELLKIGARVKEKELEKITNQTKDNDSNLEEQLSLMTNYIVKTKLKLDSFFKMMVEVQNINPDLAKRIISETRLSDEEREQLKRLFQIG